MYYARSRFVDDQRWIKGANEKAEELIAEKRHGATKLAGIAIARSEREYERIISMVKSGRVRFD